MRAPCTALSPWPRVFPGSGQAAMLSLVLLILIGCSTSETEAFMNNGSTSSPGLSGRVITKSDVATIPDLPLEALVLTIPYESVASFLAALDAEVEGDPAHLGLVVPEALFEEYVAAHARSSADGAYALDVGAGRYWVCLADIGGGGPAAPSPTYVNGCVDITVPEGERSAQDIYWGEAGVTAQ